MKKDTSLKLKRALLHLITGIGILVFSSFFQFTNWLIFTALIVGVILSLLSTATKIPLISWFLDHFELDRHKKIFPGKSFIFFLAGALIVSKLFSHDIALASIAILTFADPVSHFASRIGKKITSRRSIQGILISMLVAIIAASFFVPLQYSIPAGIFAMLAEAFIIKVWEDHIDDNFLIPLVAGTVMYIIQAFS